MKSIPFEWTSLKRLGEGLAKGDFSSAELTQYLLNCIEKHDGAIQSFIHLSEHAMEQAYASDQRRRRRGCIRGPLDGIPVALKDNYLTADMPITAGSRATGLVFACKDSACAQ